MEAGQCTYRGKFAANFTVEMTRSVRQAIATWTERAEGEEQGLGPVSIGRAYHALED